MHVHTCSYTHPHTHSHVYHICSCTHVHTHTPHSCTCTLTHSHACSRMCTLTYSYLACSHTLIHSCTHHVTHTLILTCTFTHTYTYTIHVIHTHTLTLSHILPHMHRHKPSHTHTHTCTDTFLQCSGNNGGLLPMLCPQCNCAHLSHLFCSCLTGHKDMAMGSIPVPPALQPIKPQATPRSFYAAGDPSQGRNNTIHSGLPPGTRPALDPSPASGGTEPRVPWRMALPGSQKGAH